MERFEKAKEKVSSMIDKEAVKEFVSENKKDVTRVGITVGVVSLISLLASNAKLRRINSTYLSIIDRFIDFNNDVDDVDDFDDFGDEE